MGSFLAYRVMEPLHSLRRTYSLSGPRANRRTSGGSVVRLSLRRGSAPPLAPPAALEADPDHSASGQLFARVIRSRRGALTRPRSLMPRLLSFLLALVVA